MLVPIKSHAPIRTSTNMADGNQQKHLFKTEFRQKGKGDTQAILK